MRAHCLRHSRACRLVAAILAVALSFGFASPSTADAVADPQKVFEAAVAADFGHGGSGDPKQAFTLYVMAADWGQRQAQLNVAVMLDSGRGVPHDPERAATYYAMAASQGEPRAAYDLGQLYLHGEGVPQNADLARAWLKLARAEGIEAASTLLASVPRPGHEGAQGSLTPPVLVRPVEDEAVRAAAPTGLVWTAVPQPAQPEFFVELAMLKDATYSDVYTATTAVSAVLWPGAVAPGNYAWRVFTVCQPLGRYVPSAWRGFTVR